MIFISIFFYHWKVAMIHSVYQREDKGFWRNKRFVTIILVVVLLLAVCIPASLSLSKKIWPPCPSEHSGFIHNVHNKLVDEAGCEVQLTGINWFGFETSTFSPHGLWIRNWQSMLDQIKQAGFNTIRLPYSNQLFDAS